MADGSGPEILTIFADAVNAVVNYIYGELLQIDCSNVAHIAEIARVMQIEPVVQFCDNFSASTSSSSQVKSIDQKLINRFEDTVGPDLDVEKHLQFVSIRLPMTVSQVTVSTQVFPSQLEVALDNFQITSGPRLIDVKKLGSLSVESESDASVSAAAEQSKVKIDERKQVTDNDVVTDPVDVDSCKTDVTKVCGLSSLSKCIGCHSDRTQPSKPVNSCSDDSPPKLSSQMVTHRQPENATRTIGKRLHSAAVGADDPVRKRPRSKKRVAAGRTQLSCTTCDFKTSNVRTLSAHTRGHKMASNVCFYCERPFDSAQLLTEHISNEHALTSQNDRPFVCLECGARFGSHAHMVAHLPKHSSKRPFVCNTCGASFKWRNALRNHAITHSNSKEHLCDVCGYATAHRAQLLAHRLIHTGNTLRCKWNGCEYHTIKMQNLKLHMLTHTQEKAHQCDVCGQSFSLNKNMKRHMLQHMDSATKHKCSQCDFKTLRYDKLKDHLHKVHNVGAAPERRLRINDLINQIEAVGGDPALSSSSSIGAAASDSNFNVDKGVANASSSSQVVVKQDLMPTPSVLVGDAYQMICLPENVTVLNTAGLSRLMIGSTAGDMQQISGVSAVLDHAVLVQPVSEFSAAGDMTSFTLTANQMSVSGLQNGLGIGCSSAVTNCSVADETRLFV